MQAILFALPTLILGIIAVGVALYLIRSAIAKRRERQARWYRQPRRIAGIGLLIPVLGQPLDAIFSAPALSDRLSPDTVTLFHTIGDGSVLLCFVLFLYAIWLQVRSRHPGAEETSSTGQSF